MDFEVIKPIRNVEIIAVGNSIRELVQLKEQYGDGRWRKLKGIAYVRLPSEELRLAELHWYEAHGIGKRRMKIKRFLE
jgi:hypothetical protein